MLSVQTMMDVLVSGIQVIEDHICITWVTSRKDNDFKVATQVLKDLLGVWSYVDACVDYFARWEGDG